MVAPTSNPHVNEDFKKLEQDVLKNVLLANATKVGTAMFDAIVF
jgi:hypothetical protein